jgi:hypothetical protein
VSDLHCPARIVLARTRPPGDQRWAATYESPVDLETVADAHRGELVLVVGEHGHAAEAVLVEVDADGRRVTPWPPEPSLR